MQGFLFGVSLVLVLDQLAPMVGYAPEGGNEITQFIDLIRHIGDWQWSTALIGFAALAIVLVVNATRLATWASLIALIIPSVAVVALGWTHLEQVVDVSPIPRGMPALSLPDFSLLTPQIALAAFSLAMVIAVQGAGVSQSMENLDDSRISTSKDMTAQGAANIAAGAFSGLPVGASVGQTALNVSAGARTRWGSIFSGVWMLVFVLVLAPVIEQVPMAVLGALMVFAGASSLRIGTMVSVLRTGAAPALGFLVTLIVSLVASVPMAVLAGVLLAMIPHVVAAGGDVSVQLLSRDENGRLRETEAPRTLPDEAVTVLSVRGDLFFAGAKELQENLPAVRGSTRPVVVMRMRGQRAVGATLIDVLNEYAEDLDEVGGRLYLAGVHRDVERQLTRSRKLGLGDTVHIHGQTEVLGEATEAAVDTGRQWLQHEERASEEGAGGQVGGAGTA